MDVDAFEAEQLEIQKKLFPHTKLLSGVEVVPIFTSSYGLAFRSG